MAQITYRCNLSAKGFPFTIGDVGRTVILPGPDQNFNRQVVGQGDEDKDVGIPQAYFLQNTLPTEQGYQSVRIGGPVITGTGSGLGTYCDLIFFPIGAVNNVIGLAVIAQGAFNWVIRSLQTTSFPNWGTYGTDQAVGGTAYPLASFYPTFAFIRNKIYLPRPGVVNSILEYRSGPNDLNPTATTGGFAFERLTASNGYMLGFIGNQVYWSNPVNELDFVPSAVTGAGNGQIAEMKGQIVNIVSTLGGILIYCTGNIIYGQFTGNFRQPFAFKEIYGSAGIDFPWQCTTEYNNEEQFAWTTVGVVRIYRGVAELLFGDSMQYYIRNKYAIYSPIANQLPFDADVPVGISATTAPYSRAIAFVAKRYIVLSYRPSTGVPPQTGRFTYALVYDTVLGRWGKIQIDHVKVVTITLGSAGTTLEANTSVICFLAPNGDIYALDQRYDQNFTNPGALASPSAIVLGKFQYSRSRLLTLDQIDIESCAQYTTGVDDLTTSPVVILPSYDGKNFGTPIVPFRASGPGTTAGARGLATYKCRVTAINHSIVLRGGFNVSSVVLKFHVNGQR